VTVGFHPVSGASGYLISKSLDGIHFDQGVFIPDTLAIFHTLQPDTIYYFRVRAVNAAGSSDPTEMLAASTFKRRADFLIINGFDRMSGTQNTRDFVRQHAQALWPRRVSFSSCSNEALEAGLVHLTNFSNVDWIFGEEGTETESFSPKEHELVKEFLENGGHLFVSGSEIGYDLVEKGNAEGQTFYRDFLKAQYVSDRAGRVHRVSGTAEGIFHNLVHIAFDDGTHGGYDVDYPDGFKPAGGSTLALVYDGVRYDTQGGAGIQYAGIFGNGTQPGRLVYLGFPFEMIVGSPDRAQVMARVLDFFNVNVEVTKNPAPTPQSFVLLPNYPNPVTPATHLTTTFQFRARVPAPVTIRLFNLLGRQVRVLYRGKARIGKNTIRVTLQELPAGTYFYSVQFDRKIVRGALILIH